MIRGTKEEWSTCTQKTHKMAIKMFFSQVKPVSLGHEKYTKR